MVINRISSRQRKYQAKTNEELIFSFLSAVGSDFFQEDNICHMTLYVIIRQISKRKATGHIAN